MGKASRLAKKIDETRMEISRRSYWMVCATAGREPTCAE
jgi:hypothetical protein